MHTLVQTLEAKSGKGVFDIYEFIEICSFHNIQGKFSFYLKFYIKLCCYENMFLEATCFPIDPILNQAFFDGAREYVRPNEHCFHKIKTIFYLFQNNALDIKIKFSANLLK